MMMKYFSGPSASCLLIIACPPPHPSKPDLLIFLLTIYDAIMINNMFGANLCENEGSAARDLTNYHYSALIPGWYL